jgi:MoaA/NifB/PqqE/SkfB family radical SAM enzyme
MRPPEDNLKTPQSEAEGNRENADGCVSEKVRRRPLKDSPADAEHYFSLANSSLEKKEYLNALKYFEKSAEFGRSGVDIHKELGGLYIMTVQPALALSELRQSLESVPPEDLFTKNALLNEIEIIERKEVLVSKPRGAIVHLLTDCNLKCRLCPTKDIKWKMPEKTVAELEELFPYMQTVQWLGGEVFLYEHFRRLFHSAGSCRHLHQTVQTNGLLLTDEWIELFLNTNTSVGISVDGVTEEVYGKMRGGDFGILNRNILRLARRRRTYHAASPGEKKFSLRLQVLITKHNYRYLNDFVRYGAEYGFDEIVLLPLRGSSSFLDLESRIKDEVYDSLSSIADACASNKIKLQVNLPLEPEDGASEGSAEESPLSDQDFCSNPWQWFQIEVDGKVRPHSYCITEIGNIYDDTILGIWNSSLMQAYRNKIKAGCFDDMCDEPCMHNRRLRASSRQSIWRYSSELQ